MVFRIRKEIGHGIILRVQLQLLLLKGRGCPQDDAMTNFFADSKRPILGLSNEVSFVPESLWEDG